MLSRALILATVTLSTLVASSDLQAQNLEAGKSASQIFATSCSACHRSQRGLLKTVVPGSLPGFLREHYTTSRDMAQQLSAYLLSSGATDARVGGGRLTKQGEDAKSGRQAEPAPGEAQPPGRRQRPGQFQDAARPDADGVAADPRASRKRNRADQRQATPPDGQPPGAVEDGPLTRRQKQKLGRKKGREEAPKDTPGPVETAKPDVTRPDVPKPDAPPAETPKPGEATPAPALGEPPRVVAPRSEPAPPNGSETPAIRPDPVPQVTPAPPPTQSPPPSAPVEPPAAPPASAPAPSEAPPRPTISVTPPPPPPPPSGPAAPPISQ